MGKLEWMKKHRFLIGGCGFLLSQAVLWIVNYWMWYNVITYDNYDTIIMIKNWSIGIYVTFGLIVTAYFIAIDGWDVNEDK